jgi:NAD(P)-dependent dehydrogenase (short-subunit alcohol dehydrogenase family)
MDLSSVFSLHGKVAIVTGGSRGIGYAISHYFAAAGAKVVICSRNEEMVQKKADKLKQSGYEVTGIPCDVNHLKNLPLLVENALDLYGQIDILVNNAGISPTFCNIQDLDTHTFDQLMHLNVKVPYELSRICFPYLKKSVGASIINIGAAEALYPDPNLGIFGVSKAALIALTKAFAIEWGDYRIRVNTICPGLTQTSSSDKLWTNDRLLVNRIKKLSIKRMGEDKEIAAMALFLASSAASYTTGAVLTVDGGFSI